MLRGSIRSALVAIGLVGLFAAPAAAVIDMSGSWSVHVPDTDLTWDFVQSGTVLNSTVNSFAWPGTIDPGTGVFQIHAGDMAVASAMQCGIIDATVTPDGDQFAGTYSSAPLVCSGPPHFPTCACGTFAAVGPATGVRLTSGGCGNGTVENAEQCDDGNNQNGDCCSATCAYENAGSSCLDTQSCTVDTCDGAGQCMHAPQEGCRTAAKGAAISLRDNGAAGGTLRFTWKDDSGQTSLADFGTPLVSTSYGLCVFAGNTLVYAGSAPGSTRWRATGNGFTYKRTDGEPSGLTTLKLRAAGANTKLLVKGKGPLLAIDGSLAVPSLRVQLKRDGQTPCWEAVFDQPKISQPDRFVAKE